MARQENEDRIMSDMDGEKMTAAFEFLDQTQSPGLVLTARLKEKCRAVDEHLSLLTTFATDDHNFVAKHPLTGNPPAARLQQLIGELRRNMSIILETTNAIRTINEKTVDGLREWWFVCVQQFLNLPHANQNLLEPGELPRIDLFNPALPFDTEPDSGVFNPMENIQVTSS